MVVKALNWLRELAYEIQERMIWRLNPLRKVFVNVDPV
jgi:hypothetical protein